MNLGQKSERLLVIVPQAEESNCRSIVPGGESLSYDSYFTETLGFFESDEAKSRTGHKTDTQKTMIMIVWQVDGFHVIGLRVFRRSVASQGLPFRKRN
jgi:hypothetical protein